VAATGELKSQVFKGYKLNGPDHQLCALKRILLRNAENGVA